MTWTPELIMSLGGLLLGGGSILTLIVRAVIYNSSATTRFDRGQILALNRRIDELNRKLDNMRKEYEEKLARKDEVILRREEENDKLKEQVNELKTEVRDLRHRLANVEQTTAVKRDLKDRGQ